VLQVYSKHGSSVSLWYKYPVRATNSVTNNNNGSRKWAGGNGKEKRVGGKAKAGKKKCEKW
jgi:hypothetical protein